MERDISIIQWQPLPAPREQYLLVRFKDEGEICSEVAFSVDGINFQGDTGYPFYAPIEAWAYLPYATPSNTESEKLEDWLKEKQPYFLKACEEHGMDLEEICLFLKLGFTPEELADIDKM